jgi:putative intracellular protease/amidase
MRIKPVALLAMLCAFAVGQAAAADKGKVLMVVRPGDQQIADLMLTKEVGAMKTTLSDAGYTVVVATLTGQPVKGSTVSLKPDLKLSDVKVADYRGLIVPCMAAGGAPAPSEAMEILKKALALGKPIAAQNSAVLMIGQAGALKGRHFAIEADLASSIAGGIYSGIGVVQDGNIVTSGTCPFMAQELKKPDGTVELTRKLIALIQ